MSLQGCIIGLIIGRTGGSAPLEIFPPAGSESCPFPSALKIIKETPGKTKI